MKVFKSTDKLRYIEIGYLQDGKNILSRIETAFKICYTANREKLLVYITSY